MGAEWGGGYGSVGVEWGIGGSIRPIPVTSPIER